MADTGYESSSRACSYRELKALELLRQLVTTAYPEGIRCETNTLKIQFFKVCVFAQDYFSYSLNTKFYPGKREQLYKYFTFASASGRCCPPDPLPGLCPWTPSEDLHPQTLCLCPLLENMWIHV